MRKSTLRNFPPLAEKVRYYKEDEEGNGSMCRIVEEEVKRENLIAEKRGEARGKAIGEAVGEARGKAIGEAMGEKNAKEKTALTMIRKGALTLEDIAEYSGLTLDEVKELAKKHTA